MDSSFEASFVWMKIGGERVYNAFGSVDHDLGSGDKQ
jgi:hypothetical protein